MAVALNQEERSKTRYYLGYPNLESRSLYVLGFPVTVPTALILEENMRSINDEFSLSSIRGILAQLDAIRCEINKARSRLKFTDVAYTIKSNIHEIDQLWDEDYKLCVQLSTFLSVPIFKHPTGRNDFHGNGISIMD